MRLFIKILLLCCIFIFPGIAEGTVISECKILESETIIDAANTTAVVDTVNQRSDYPSRSGKISLLVKTMTMS